MFLPIGDTPNPRNFIPMVNWLLIGANVAIYLFISLPLSQQGVDPGNPLVQEYYRFLLTKLPYNIDPQQVLAHVSAYDIFIFQHGYKPAGSQWSDLFFSMFLHANFAHLGGNMLFLYIYGDNIEHRLGRAGYLLVYILTGIIATLTFSLFAATSLTPMVGASGAISGVLGLYFLIFPANKVKVFILLFPILFHSILIPARWVLGLYVVLQNLLPFIINAKTGVAYGAHLGGFLAGLAIARLGEQWSWPWPWSHRRGPPERPSPPPFSIPTPSPSEPGPLVRQLSHAIARNDLRHSFQLVRQAQRHELAQLHPRECARLAGWIEEAGHAVQAARLLRGYLSDNSQLPGLAEVHLLLGLIRLKEGEYTVARQYLLDALDADPDPITEARARQALRQIENGS